MNKGRSNSASIEESEAEGTLRAWQIKPRRRRRRIWRIALGTLAVLALLVVLALWTVTRSWFIIGQLTPEMERKLGGRVTIGKAAYQGDGRIVFTDIALRAPGLQGTGGEVARIPRAVVTIDSILSGLHVSEVEIDGSVLRLSEDRHESGRLNFMSLRPDWSGAGTGPTVPPRISIRNAALEFGTHLGSDYETRGRRLVSGEMYPTSGAPGWYNFQLVEVDEQGNALGQNGIFLKGQWKPSSNEYHARIDGLELDDRIYKMCPQKAQLLWNKMDLQGTVDAVLVDWTPGSPFSVEFAVKNVALTLPINDEALVIWARYKDGQISPFPARPRLHVNSGTIRLGSDSLVLDKLRGEIGGTDSKADLVGVPYNISFTLSALPPIDWPSREQWMDQVLKTAPFELKFRMDEFALTRNAQGEAPAVDLPLVVARVLAKFQVTDWVLSTSVDITRGAAEVDPSGQPVPAKAVTSGQTYIHKASGRYQKFPYQLDDVDAYLQFDNDKVVVHYLTGSGSGKSRFRITGEIAPPDNNARVALHVTGTDVPLDDRFRAALKDRELQTFDSMFHRPSAESLSQAGMLPDEAWIEALRKDQLADGDRLAKLRSEPDSGGSDHDAEVAALSGDMARRQHSIDAGPFQLGGTVDIDLNIDRPAGPAQPTTTTGTINLRNVGLLYEKFPYPLRFSGGTLDWRPDRVVIVPGNDGNGLQFTAPGGGSGSVTGELAMGNDRSRRKMVPNLTIKVHDDGFTPSIYAAIPLSKSEQHEAAGHGLWPGGALSHAARIVQGIGFAGGCDYSGVIATDADSAITYDFNVVMREGSAHPTLQLAQSLGASDEFWPDVTLRGVSGSMSISRERIDWTNVNGGSGQCRVACDGSIDITGDDPGTHVSVNMHSVPLEHGVLSLASGPMRERLLNIWDRVQPQGLFDSTVEYDSRSEPGRRLAINVLPKQISMQANAEPLMLTGGEGVLRFGTGGMEFDQLTLSLSGEGDRDDGVVTLNGSLPFDGNGDRAGARLDGTWRNGRFESSLIPELISAMGSDERVDDYRQCNPAGQFEATFHLEPAADSAALQFGATIEPRSASIEWNGSRVFAEIERGQVLLKPGLIQLQELRGRHSDGIFDLSGAIKTGGQVDVDLSIGYSGRARCPQVEAFLPEPAREAIEAIKFSDGDAPTRADFNIHCTHAELESEDSGWQSQVNGRVQTQNASFVAGVQFTQVNGEFDLDVQHVPGTPVGMTLQARARRAVVLGQELTNIEAPMALSSDGQALHMPSMSANAGLGVVTGDATVGIGDRRDYQASLQLVGVPADSFMNAGREQPTSRPDDPKSHAPGEVYGSLTLSGNRGETYTRSGRAVLRMLHGKMASIPLAMQVVQMFQFTLPFSGTFDYADANMYVSGDRVVFERILFESTLGNKAMLQLLGEGEMNINTLDLNARFRSRSGVAVVRDTVGSILDRLYEIEVSGTLGDPRARVVPLPAK